MHIESQVIVFYKPKSCHDSHHRYHTGHHTIGKKGIYNTTVVLRSNAYY